MRLVYKLLLSLLFLAPSSAFAYNIPYSTVGSTSQVILFQSVSVTGAGNSFIGLNGNVAQPSTVTPTASRLAMLPCQGLANGFGIKVATAPGVGNSWTVTLRQNPFGNSNTNNATGITCTISDTNNTCNDNVNTFEYTPGDAPLVKLVASGNPASTTFAGGMVFYPYDPGCTMIGGGGAALTAGSVFKTALTVTSNWTGNPNAAGISRNKTLIPFAGTIKNFYTKIQTTQTAPNGTTFAVVNETTNATTSIIAYQLSGVPTATDLVDTAQFGDGDFASVVATTTATYTNASGSWGAGLYANNTGDFMIAGGEANSSGGDSATLNTLLYLIGTQGTTTLTDAQGYIPGDMLFKKVEVWITTPPGAGKSRNFYVMVNGATTTSSCNISGATAQTCIISSPIGLSQGDLVNYVDEPVGSPAVSQSIKISADATRYFVRPQYLYSGGKHVAAGGQSSYGAPLTKGIFNVLVVGAGGGAGSGGGGAGGLISNTVFPMYSGAYSVAIGVGGSAGGAGTAGGNGGDSSISTLIAKGGGGGGSNNIQYPGAGGPTAGGSGGGIGRSSTAGQTAGAPALGTQGNAGGNTVNSSPFPSAGGGGAGAVGANGSGSASGNGGAGVSNSISGASVAYAGGGGGGSGTTPTGGTGGTGGGGNGAASGTGANGTANRGGGAGGGDTGGAGGSGTVVIAYPTGQYQTVCGGSFSQSGGNDICTFVGNGVFTFIK